MAALTAIKQSVVLVGPHMIHCRLLVYGGSLKLMMEEILNNDEQSYRYKREILQKQKATRTENQQVRPVLQKDLVKFAI